MNVKGIESTAKTIRLLAMDAVQKANSGHPGMPMGCAELGALLFAEIMNHFPGDPGWIDRDRFVLSAGHGSMLLYSLLHLSGYDLPLDELKDFRQLGSRTPGHPEYNLKIGVETTTGPLGQGISNAVGMAMAERMLAARFNTEKHAPINHFTYVIAGDGDLMEGVSSEACSLAGHLGLGKLIVFYDSNRISIEGSTELAFTEDVAARFSAYHWQTLHCSAYDLEGIMRCVEQARAEKERPSLIVMESIIAKGSPNMAGSHETHGAPLGEEEVRATKRALGVPEDSSFLILAEARDYFETKKPHWVQRYQEWQRLFSDWAAENPDLKQEWDRFFASPRLEGVELPGFEEGEKIATRKASGKILNALAALVPNMVGGSADLAPSNNTEMKGMGSFQRDNPGGRNFHFGVREHGMGAICSGIALHGGLRPYCATFLVFSDYMRPSVRLAALMGIPVIYIFTHDSVFLGEDGPTHQPVEQLAALRAIPGLMVLRPGDAEETEVAWRMAIERLEGPTALALTRQSLAAYAKDDSHWREKCRRGAYRVREAESGDRPEVVLVASGSEVNLALEVRNILGPERVRVVSMICRELFLRSTVQEQRELLPPGVLRVVMEAGVSQGWREVAGDEGIIYSIDRFGESAPAAKLAEYFGFTPEKIAADLKNRLQ